MIKVIINIIIGGIFVWIGFYGFILKTESILSFFGSMPAFEKYLGADGGSRLGYKLLGIVIIILGLLLAFGLFENFVLWVFSPLTKYNNTPAVPETVYPAL